MQFDDRIGVKTEQVVNIEYYNTALTRSETRLSSIMMTGLSTRATRGMRSTAHSSALRCPSESLYFDFVCQRTDSLARRNCYLILTCTTGLGQS